MRSTSSASLPPTSSLGTMNRARLSSDRTKDMISKDLDDGDKEIRKPCRYGLGCYRRNEEHLRSVAHPDDEDYALCVRKHGAKAEFGTLMQCFSFMDPYKKGLIDDKSLLGELLHHVEEDVTDERVDEIWEAVDDDGNGYASFAEFVQWVRDTDHQPLAALPVGMDDTHAATTGNRECLFPGCKCKNFTPRADNERFCRCGHKRGLHSVSSDKAIQVPSYWANSDAGITCEWVDCDDFIVGEMQKVMDASAKRSWTRDRGRDENGKTKPVPVGFEVIKVKRNENPKIWRKYALKRGLIKENLAQDDLPDEDAFQEFPVKTGGAGEPGFTFEEPMDASCNEWFLWHGTSVEGAKRICEVDFQQRLAGTATGTLYGPGTYFAESCTKADEYAKVVVGDLNEEEDEDLLVMMLCRVVGGRVKYTDEVEPDTEVLVDSVMHGHYDSVLGDREKCRNTFKEFVIYGSDQVYPEYVVMYKRKM